MKRSLTTSLIGHFLHRITNSSSMLRWLVLSIFACWMLQLHAQTREISLSYTNTPIKVILTEIEKQSECYFVYNHQLIDVERKISISVKKESLKNVLKIIFPGNDDPRFEIVDKQVILSPRKMPTGANADESSSPQVTASVHQASLSTPARQGVQQTRPALSIVSGMVCDEKKEVLVGALISVKNEERRFITDNYGKFEIRDISPDAVLIISYLGYATQEFPLRGRTNPMIQMEVNITLLDKVVVTGYQTLSRERATGAFGKVLSDAVENRHSSSLGSALLGSVAGMQANVNRDGTLEYTIRGISSMHANSSPLIVVDGFPVSTNFEDINPNDVADVTVLKDAAAASIWGARSANGVIVVTTKKAKEKLSVNVGAQLSIGRKFDLDNALTTASSNTFIDYEEMAFPKAWMYARYYDYFNFDIFNPMSTSMQAMHDRDLGTISEEEYTEKINRLRGLNNRGQIEDLLMQNPILQQYTFSISSAAEKSKNYVSMMYENSKGNMVGNSADRIRVNFNNQTPLFKWLDFSLATTLHYQSVRNNGATLGEIAHLSPYEMLLNSDGSYANQLMDVNPGMVATIPEGELPYEDWSYNLLREVRARDISTESLSVRLQAGLTFKLFKGFSFDTRLQYEYIRGEDKSLYKEDSYYVRNRVNRNVSYDPFTGVVDTQFIPKGAILQSNTKDGDNYQWRNQLNYSYSADKHDIAVVAGIEMSNYETQYRINPWVYGFNPNNNTTLPLLYSGRINQGVNYTTIDGYRWNGDLQGIDPRMNDSYDRYVSIYANAAYTFDRRYGISVSARSDASNLITSDPKYRWAPLWSVGTKWNISNESFMSDSPGAIDMLALRLTYGYNGNVDKRTSSYTCLAQVPLPRPSTRLPSYYIASRGNPNLRWERTGTINSGIDFSLWKGLLSGSVDVYSKQGKDIIGSISVPRYSGTDELWLNQAEISNKGIEIALASEHTFKAVPITLATQVTYAYNKNKVKKLLNNNALSIDYIYHEMYAEGYPIGTVWSYKYLGMEGDEPMVAGPDMPYTISDASWTDESMGNGHLVNSGTRIPPHSLGWNGSIRWKNLGASFLVLGNFGGVFRAPAFEYPSFNSGSKNTVSRFYEEVGKDPNKLPTIPEDPDFMGTESWFVFVQGLHTLVESSSHIRLQEVTIDYSLPGKLLKRTGLQQVKLYAQARDLGCLWTKNSYGYDPEYLPGTIKPPTTFVLGLNINF